MSNFNEENQDEEDIEETSPISSQDALLAIEKVNLFVEQQFKEFTMWNENVKKKIKKQNSIQQITVF